MITDAMVRAAWCALPRHVQDLVDGDEMRRVAAAVVAARKEDEFWDTVTVAAQRAGGVVPQRPDAEGDW